MNAPTRRTWIVRVAALAAVTLFLALIARFWHPVYRFTALLQFDESAAGAMLPELRERPLYVYHDTGGYDGLYYAQIALHPALDAPGLPGAIDNLSYRARRILPPALAWLLGAGDPDRILCIYPLLNVVAWLALAALLWRLMPVADLRGWLAWAGLLFSAGAIASVRLSLSDLIAVTILAGAYWAMERERFRTATVALGLSGLARETTLLGLAGIAARPWWSRANVTRGLIAVTPLLLWFAYLRYRVGPADQGWSNLTAPLTGFAGKWGESISAVLFHEDFLLALTTLLATAGLTVQAVYFVLRRDLHDPWWRLGAAYTGLMATLGTPVWEDFPGAAQRVLLPLALAFNLRAVRQRAALTWIVAGNLAVGSGLLFLRDVPHDNTELGAGHAGDVAVIARLDPPWSGAEHNRSHRWAWSAGSGNLTLETWPRVSRTILVHCTLRSLTSRTLTASQDGHVIWSSHLGDGPRLTVAIPVQTRNGRATFTLSTDTPGVRRPGDPRSLAFAVYDPTFSLPQP